MPSHAGAPVGSRSFPQALFILTSDLELDSADNQMSCEIDSFEDMLDSVRDQSERFWRERQMHTPDWWDRLPLVPFRELCAEELSQAAHKYLTRQAEMATRYIEADLERRSSWAIGAQRALKWAGSVRFGPGSLNVLDAYVTEKVAENKLVGGRQGAWVISDLHQAVMRPALQALTTTSEEGETVVTGGGHHAVKSWLNYTTITYTAEVCLEVWRGAEGGLPRIRLSRMQHMCY